MAMAGNGDYTQYSYDGDITRTKVAAHCLALKIYLDEAEKVLEEAPQDEINGIFAFNAEMTLKVWHEKGFLQVYKK
jgi:hypothetical protein